jgi:hypothetical protein
VARGHHPDVGGRDAHRLLRAHDTGTRRRYRAADIEETIAMLGYQPVDDAWATCRKG